MNRRSSFMFAYLLVTVSGCASSGESSRVRDFLGERAAKILAAADRVEVFRIGPTRAPSDAGQKLAGYPLLAAGKEQGSDFARRLGAVLINDSTYEWDSANGCMFDPGVAFRVWSGKDSILALVCFQCNDIGIVSDESDPASLRTHDADPGRAALLQLAREAFPADSDLQKLAAR